MLYICYCQSREAALTKLINDFKVGDTLVKKFKRREEYIRIQESKSADIRLFGGEMHGDSRDAEGKGRAPSMILA